MICPCCKQNTRKLHNELAMKFKDHISVVRTEKAVCKDCLEDQFWEVYQKAQADIRQQQR